MYLTYCILPSIGSLRASDLMACCQVKGGVGGGGGGMGVCIHSNHPAFGRTIPLSDDLSCCPAFSNLSCSRPYKEKMLKKITGLNPKFIQNIQP